MVCKNHKGNTARRKCYACKSWICPECQIKNNHHIFCSEACIESAIKPSTADAAAPMQDFSTKLNEFDRSLNEDLREYGETIVDQIKQNLDQVTKELHKELQHKQEEHSLELSALKQGVFSYRNFLQQWVEDKDKQIQKFERSMRILDKRESNRTKKVSKNIHRNAEALDASLKETQRKINEQLLNSIDQLEKKISSVQDASEKEFHEFSRKMDDRIQSVADNVSENISALAKEQGAFQKDLKENFFSTFSQLEKKLEQTQAQSKAFLEDFSKTLGERHKTQSDAMLDDVSALLAAQKGNWDEILQAASQGAKDASLSLKDILNKKLNEQLLEVAKLESEGLRKVSSQAKAILVDRIQSQISPWPKRASMAAFTLSITTLVVIPLLFFSIRKMQQTQLTSWNQSLLEQWKEVVRSEVGSKNAPTTSSEEPKVTVVKVPSVSNMNRGSVTSKQVSFTFDGGSNSKAAEDILAILKKFKVQSTIFLTGEFIESNPELVKRIIAEGHEVGNHLYRHAHMVDMKTMTSAYSKTAFLDELEQVEHVFHDITGKSMSRYWRAPYGEVSSEQLSWAREQGYTHIGWTTSKSITLDTMDWVSDPRSKLFKTPEQIASKIMNFEKTDPNGLNGAIVLMHLGSERDEPNMAYKALPSLFQNLIQKGYKIVPVTELINTELAQK